MRADWHLLAAELAIWHAEHLSLPIWWRDDDVIAPTAALDKLLSTSERLNLPVHLAAVPKHISPALADRCLDDPSVVMMVHGWSHENTLPYEKKKSEFGRLTDETAEVLKRALYVMQDHFGKKLVNTFVPPWNRISSEVIEVLPGAGYTALSTYAPRSRREIVKGLVQINTHIDPIHWRGERGLLDPDIQINALVAHLQDRRAGHADRTEPLGLLTHHLVHNPEIWQFADHLLQRLLDGGATPVNLLDHKGRLP
jgi:hypothetical protein